MVKQEKIGFAYGKSDLNRIGIFSEQKYISVGEAYVSKKGGSTLDYRASGKQFMTAPLRSGHDSKEAYFDQKFIRLFENEPFTDLVQIRRKHRANEKTKNISKEPFKPSSVPPKPSGKGSHWGTIEQQWPIKNPKLELPPRPVKKEKKVPQLKNFITSPGKKGSGYSYTSVTIGKQFEYSSDPYDQATIKERAERKAHLEKIVGTKAFVSSSTNQEYFNQFMGLTTKQSEPQTTDKKKILVPFKPTGNFFGAAINPYPSYEAPKGEEKPHSGPGKNYIFKPSGVMGSYPIRSIVESNVPLAPAVWIQNTLSELLKN